MMLYCSICVLHNIIVYNIIACVYIYIYIYIHICEIYVYIYI